MGRSTDGNRFVAPHVDDRPFVEVEASQLNRPPRKGSQIRVRPLVVDIGGEGRHPLAWNVNPRASKTFGPQKGQSIPRWIPGRGEAVPLADQQADMIIVERTPLSRSAIEEIRRIARPGARVVLRHPRAFGFDPHRLAMEMLAGQCRRGMCLIGASLCQETIIDLPVDG